MLLGFLWSLVEVHSQTQYPYVSFMGETLANHAYVDLSLVGTSASDSVQCHTDLDTCCTMAQGDHRGDWIPPGSEQRLPFQYDSSSNIYEDYGHSQVGFHRRNNADRPYGIYRCDIPTNADNDTSVRKSVYVGLYPSGGIVVLFTSYKIQNTILAVVFMALLANITIALTRKSCATHFIAPLILVFHFVAC